MMRKELAIAVVTASTSLTLQGCFFNTQTTTVKPKTEPEKPLLGAKDAPTKAPSPTCDEMPKTGDCVFAEENANLSTGWAPNTKCSDGRDFCKGYNACGECEMFKPCCKWKPGNATSTKDGVNKTNKTTEDEEVEKLVQGIKICGEGHKHECPHEWKDGGFHCNDHGGCRTRDDGPFGEASCKEQCFMEPAVAEKAREDEPGFMKGQPICNEGHQHECPAEWKDGGFHCNGHGGCRTVEQGPFPKADCEDQCFIAPRTKDGVEALVEDRRLSEAVIA